MPTATATLAAQARTSRIADRHRETVLDRDYAFVTKTMDWKVEEVAATLGRTYHATCTLRALVRTGQVRAAARRVAASDRPYRGWVEGMSEE